MKAYTKTTGEIIIQFTTANQQERQMMFHPNGLCKRTNLPQTALDAIGESTIDGTLYGMVENAVAVADNSPSKETLECVYNMVEEALSL